ncbi:hypothetical protein M573_135002 [Prevotella intermedia ZT]|uniref:Uncharacterized protein n=1 Tax=Prevotella intermedia ZT TaxID=1347790 RepID=A0AAP0V144_PREIN|nr:hypothetical protein M573_135002 [Prevotella intermedia ZT]
MKAFLFNFNNSARLAMLLLRNQQKGVETMCFISEKKMKIL